MKENEEITNLERFELLIEDCKGHRELYGESFVGEYDIEIMQHILSDYKRVLKENEEKNKIKEQKECTFREYGAEEGLWYCSNCHDEWLFYEGTPEENNLKYCPHCGAKVIKYESYIESEE